MPDRATAMVARGKTYFHGGTAVATGGAGVVGTISVLPDTDPSDRTKRRTQGDITAILVRNVSGIALLPKHVVKWKAGKEFFEVDGYCNVVNERVAGVVDDHLPAAGAPDDDIFWLIVKGPCLVVSSKATLGVAADLGDPLYAAVAAASTVETTAGRWNRLAAQIITGEAGMDIVHNAIGYALTARTANNTDTDTLVDLRLDR